MGTTTASTVEVHKERSKKKKSKPIKVVIRRLPPFITWEELSEQLAPLNDTEYTAFVPADPTFAPHSFARCYLAFSDEASVLDFSNRFNRYIFVDSKGNESMALVELAMYPRVPKKSREDVKLDGRCGIIENELEYKQFVDKVESEQNCAVLTLEEQLRHVQLREASAKAGSIQNTPLTQYLVKKNDEKYQRVEERRRAREEERRRIRKQKLDAEKRERRDQRDAEREKRKGSERGQTDANDGTASNSNVEDFDAKREDWDKFKKDLGIGVQKEQKERRNERGAADVKDRERPVRERGKFGREARGSRDAAARPETRNTDTGEVKESRRPERTERTFVRSSKPRTERVTAVSKEPTEKKPRNRPERAIYRPGQRSKKPTEESKEAEK